MTDGIPQRLEAEDDRDAILLAEVAAYLHMIGKLSGDFLAHESREKSINFDYQDVCRDPSFLGERLHNLLTDAWVQPRFRLLGVLGDAGAPRNIDAFIRQHARKRGQPLPTEPLLRFLVDAHGIVGGVEKNLPELWPTRLKQRRVQTWRATAFGYEEENLATEDLDACRGGVVEKLAGLLETVRASLREGSSPDWHALLLSADGFRRLLEPVMSRALGDTRRPVNDVSLWDQSYMTAALLKSSLARVVLEGYRDPLSGRRPEWRILSVTLNRWTFVRKAVRLGDVDGYQAVIDNAFDKVKGLVEVDVPLGCEIYRDTTGIFFTFPGVADGLLGEILDTLRPRLLRIVQDIEPEFAPHVFTTRASRSVVVLAEAIRDARDAIARPYRTSTVTAALRLAWGHVPDGREVCPVCRLRPKPEREEACEHCRGRRVGRAAKWLETRRRTIWLDEAADARDRCALVVARFDLQRWLDGAATESLRSLTVEEFLDEWNRRSPGNEIQNHQELVQGLAHELESDATRSSLLKALHPGYQFSGGARAFWDVIVAERDVSALAESIDPEDWNAKARVLALFLFRKHPSPARLRRFWKTTATFFGRDVVQLFDDRLGVRSGHERSSFEIEWTGSSPRLQRGATLDIVVEGVELSPVWDGSSFVSTWTASLLPAAWRSAAREAARALHGRAVALRHGGEPRGRIRRATALGDDAGSYAAWIPVLLSPDQFVAVVPADQALGLAREVFRLYSDQFAKVLDRLPLHLGVLTFHRRLPLYAAVDAAYRVFDSAAGASREVSASLLEIDAGSPSTGGALNGARGDAMVGLRLGIEEGPLTGESLDWRFSRSTADPEVEDRWTANVRFAGAPIGHRGAFQAADGSWFVPVTELRRGDRIRVRPSVVTLQHLDRAGVRFEAGCRWLPAEALERITRIGAVLIEGIRTRRWSIRQIRALRDLVEERRTRWGVVTLEFVAACVARHLGLDPGSEHGELVQAALFDGMFGVALFWNFEIARIAEDEEDSIGESIHA